MKRLGRELDGLISSYTLRQIWSIVSTLELPALCTLACVNKTWLTLFIHPDFKFWPRLIEKNGTSFKFVNISLKPFYSALYYIGRWGASYCDQCGISSHPELRGDDEEELARAALSVYRLSESNEYVCINRDCGAPLKRTEGGINLTDLFRECLRASRKKEKSHTWDEINQDLLKVDGSPIEDNYFCCTRCGLLRLDETYDDGAFCEGCCHLSENCTCAPCTRCKLMPHQCDCEICSECNRCTGCDGCKAAKKRRCKCVFCEDCGLVECECDF